MVSVADVERIPVVVPESDRARAVLRVAHDRSQVEARDGSRHEHVHSGTAAAPNEASRGVEVSDIIESEEANYISFADPDGNPIYVGDWDPDFDEEHEPHDAVGSTTP